MSTETVIREWLKIDYYYMAKRIGFINKSVFPSHQLILKTIRTIDYETTMVSPVNVNKVISLLALMWEHIDKKKYDIKDFVIKYFLPEEFLYFILQYKGFLSSLK